MQQSDSVSRESGCASRLDRWFVYRHFLGLALGVPVLMMLLHYPELTRFTLWIVSAGLVYVLLSVVWIAFGSRYIVHLALVALGGILVSLVGWGSAITTVYTNSDGIAPLVAVCVGFLAGLAIPECIGFSILGKEIPRGAARRIDEKRGTYEIGTWSAMARRLASAGRERSDGLRRERSLSSNKSLAWVLVLLMLLVQAWVVFAVHSKVGPAGFAGRVLFKYFTSLFFALGSVSFLSQALRYHYWERQYGKKLLVNVLAHRDKQWRRRWLANPDLSDRADPARGGHRDEPRPPRG